MDTRTCIECKLTKPIGLFCIRKTKKGTAYASTLCRKCKSLRVVKTTQTKVIPNIRRRLSKVRHRCNLLDLPFDLDELWVREQLDRSEWRCSVTGDQMTLASAKGENATDTSWSIDRVDPSVGYTKTNVRFVTNGFNRWRSNFTDGELLRMADALRKSLEGGPS